MTSSSSPFEAAEVESMFFIVAPQVIQKGRTEGAGRWERGEARGGIIEIVGKQD